MGSEMCIRDRSTTGKITISNASRCHWCSRLASTAHIAHIVVCLLMLADFLLELTSQLLQYTCSRSAVRLSKIDCRSHLAQHARGILRIYRQLRLDRQLRRLDRQLRSEATGQSKEQASSHTHGPASSQVPSGIKREALGSAGEQAEQYRKREQPGRVKLYLCGFNPKNRGCQGVLVYHMHNAVLPDVGGNMTICLLYTSPSPRDGLLSRMPSSA